MCPICPGSKSRLILCFFTHIPRHTRLVHPLLPPISPEIRGHRVNKVKTLLSPFTHIKYSIFWPWSWVLLQALFHFAAKSGICSLFSWKHPNSGFSNIISSGWFFFLAGVSYWLHSNWYRFLAFSKQVRGIMRHGNKLRWAFGLLTWTSKELAKCKISFGWVKLLNHIHTLLAKDACHCFLPCYTSIYCRCEQAVFAHICCDQ